MPLNLAIETEQEDDGRWIAEIPSLPGVLVYGDSREEALVHAQALALRVLADRWKSATLLTNQQKATDLGPFV